MVLYCRGLAGFLLPSSDFGIAMKGGECGPYINRVIDGIPSACLRATNGLFGFIGVTILNGWMPGVSSDLARMVDLEAAWCLYKDCFPGKLAHLSEHTHFAPWRLVSVEDMLLAAGHLGVRTHRYCSVDVICTHLTRVLADVPAEDPFTGMRKSHSCTHAVHRPLQPYRVPAMNLAKF